MLKSSKIWVAGLALILVACGGPSGPTATTPAFPSTTPTASPLVPASSNTALAPTAAQPASPAAPPSPSAAAPTVTSGAGGNFIVANPVDLSQIAQISKFRSCAGHDYSGLNVDGVPETSRSMKHYLAPLAQLRRVTGKIKVIAPFDGTLASIQEEQFRVGSQLMLGASSVPGWYFVFFHINLDPALRQGSALTAGQLLGYANVDADAHDFDVALKNFGQMVIPGAQNQGQGNRAGASSGPGSGQGGGQGAQQSSQGGSQMPKELLDSPFLHMSPAVLDQYKAKGVTPDNIITPRVVRDARPCDFNTPPSADDWVDLK